MAIKTPERRVVLVSTLLTLKIFFDYPVTLNCYYQSIKCLNLYNNSGERGKGVSVKAARWRADINDIPSTEYVKNREGNQYFWKLWWNRVLTHRAIMLKVCISIFKKKHEADSLRMNLCNFYVQVCSKFNKYNCDFFSNKDKFLCECHFRRFFSDRNRTKYSRMVQVKFVEDSL